MTQGKKIVVKQVRSQNGRCPVTRRTLKALGLGKIGTEREYVSNNALAGMLRRVEHLLDVREAK